MVRLLDGPPADGRFDAVVIGSGFGAAFFLHRFLERSPRARRILVLERGGAEDHAWQLEHGRNAAIDHLDTIALPQGHKTWTFTIGLGGGTNCWWGVTPRMHPSDFRLASLYGVGRDWPIGYDDLEPFYSAAEEIMSISGDEASAAVFPRSAPYPQPPHRMTSADEILAGAFPGLHFPMPTARSRVPTPGRGVCCATAACHLCPNDAKFTAHNGMAGVFGDPRVSVLVDARVTGIETRAGLVSAVAYEHGGAMHRAACDLCVLGANAIFSPYILEQSGMATPLTGRGICEQLGVEFVAHLDGLDALDGSTVLTGLNLVLFEGEHRRRAGAAALHFRSHWRYGGLRLEEGRWRQSLPFLAVIEDLPDDANHVASSDRPGVPLVWHPRRSTYAERGLARVRDRLDDLLRPLPVEALIEIGPRPTESHLQGTLRMGTDPADSVVDADLVHHGWRNLIVVGSSVFPTCQTANPSLTVAALALRAAERAA